MEDIRLASRTIINAMKASDLKHFLSTTTYKGMTIFDAAVVAKSTKIQNIDYYEKAMKQLYSGIPYTGVNKQPTVQSITKHDSVGDLVVIYMGIIEKGAKLYEVINNNKDVKDKIGSLVDDLFSSCNEIKNYIEKNSDNASKQTQNAVTNDDISLPGQFTFVVDPKPNLPLYNPNTGTMINVSKPNGQSLQDMINSDKRIHDALSILE